MNDLDLLYVALLRDGLVLIRNAARCGDFEWCKAESEYLHEIPSLIGNANLRGHVYQATGARELYLDWIRRNERSDVREYVDLLYAPLWVEMDKIIGIGPS